MTTWQSLLYCAGDVTLERIKNLVAVTGTEPIIVHSKSSTPRSPSALPPWPTCTAA